MSTFPTYKLGNSTVPSIAYGFGTAWFKIDESQGVNRSLVEAAKLAIKNGYTHLDAADVYANETSVGAGIKESGVAREKLFITTKLMSDNTNVRETFLNQLKKLQVDYVDLYLIHDPFNLDKPGFLTTAEYWKTLEDLKDEGLIKEIGVSNFLIPDLKKVLAVAKHKPVANQIEFHPDLYKVTKPLLDFMKEHDIRAEAYGPSSNAFRNADGPVNKLATQYAEEFSKSTGKEVTSTQVLLKYVAQLGIIVVTTSSKESRIKEQLAAYGIPDLTQEQIDALSEAEADKPVRYFMQQLKFDVVNGWDN